jgi:hypothetical protein
MSGTDAGYAFGDGIPVNPVDSGSTLLVAGPALSAAEDLALSMVADAGEREGSLFISTNMTHGKLLKTCRRTHPSLDTSLLGVIDCSGQGFDGGPEGVRVKYVSTQSDLTGIGMKFSSLYEALYAEAEGSRVRTGLVSLSSLLMYVDLRKLFQFAQTISGRIDSADGLGVFTIDPTTHDTKTVNTLSQVVDGRIEVRGGDDNDAEGELRVRGLRDQPDGWQPFSLS